MRNVNPFFIRSAGWPAALVAGAMLATLAPAKDLDPDLRQQVIASCSADAYRLCPQSLGTESEAVSCMRHKRRELSDVCRSAYDRVVRTLAAK